MRRSLAALAGVLATLSCAAAGEATPPVGSGEILRGALAPAQKSPAPEEKSLADRMVSSDRGYARPAMTVGMVSGSRAVVIDSQSLAQPRSEVAGLRGTVEAALSSSDKLRAATYDAKAAEKAVLRELAGYVPTISANAGQSIDEGISDQRDGQSRYASLNLTMPLFTSGRRYFDVKSAKSLARASVFRTAVARDGVVLDTAEAYLQHIYGVMAETAIQRSETTMRRLLQSLKAQHRSGFASGADVAEVTAELEAIQQQMIEVRATRAKSQDKLNAATMTRVHVGMDFPRLEKALASGREALRASAARRNPNILVAVNTADASRSSSNSVFASHLPQVTLNAEYRRLYGEIRDFGERDRTNIGVRLTVPLVDLSTVASIGESRMRAKADEYRAADMRREVESQFDQVWEEYQSGAAREELAKQRISSLTKVTDAANARFRKGLIGLDILLDAERKLTSGEIELAQLKVANTLAATQLLVIAGVFTPAMLDL